MRPARSSATSSPPSKALTTLPISIFVVGMAVATLPAGALARHHGRRAASLVGTGAGVLAGLLAMVAAIEGMFWLYCLSSFVGGAYGAVVLSFRFAAADCVTPERQPRAMSLVMAGGVFAGVIGPQLVNHTMDLWPPYLFAATHLGQAAVAALSALVLAGVHVPMPSREEIARQPRFVVAVVCRGRRRTSASSGTSSPCTCRASSPGI